MVGGPKVKSRSFPAKRSRPLLRPVCRPLRLRLHRPLRRLLHRPRRRLMHRPLLLPYCSRTALVAGRSRVEAVHVLLSTTACKTHQATTRRARTACLPSLGTSGCREWSGGSKSPHNASTTICRSTAARSTVVLLAAAAPSRPLCQSQASRGSRSTQMAVRMGQASRFV